MHGESSEAGSARASEPGRVALTFDDGPDEWTGPILDVLSEHSARATFFLIGRAARRREDLVRRIAAEGHEIGNHTWSHPWLARDCDDDRVRTELRRANDALSEIAGATPRRFRAPHYDVDPRVLAIAAQLGLEHTRGDVTPPDWDERCSAGYITTFVLQQARANAVVGLHDGVAANDGTRSQQRTVDAVVRVVPGLLERGFELVPASELLDSS